MRVSKKSALSEFRFGAPVAQDSAILLEVDPSIDVGWGGRMICLPHLSLCEVSR